MRSYFDDSEVYYVPVGDVEALAAALKECAEKADKTFARVKNAQAKLLAHELTTKDAGLRVQ